MAKVQGTQISSATAVLSTTSNQWAVLLTLKSAGAAAFGALTSHLYHTYYSAAAAGNEDDYWLTSSDPPVNTPSTCGPSSSR